MRKFAEYLVTCFAVALTIVLTPIFKWRCKRDKHIWKDNPMKENQEYCLVCWTVKDKN